MDEFRVFIYLGFNILKNEKLLALFEQCELIDQIWS